MPGAYGKIVYEHTNSFLNIHGNVIIGYLILLAVAYALIVALAPAFFNSARLLQVRWQVWLAVFVAASICDAASTYYALSPATTEMNPILQYLFKKIGVSWGLVLHSAGATIILLLVGLWKGTHASGVRFITFILGVTRLCAAAWNIMGILLHA